MVLLTLLCFIVVTRSLLCSDVPQCPLIAQQLPPFPHSPLSSPIDCSRAGHWPLKKSCKSSHSLIHFNPETRGLYNSNIDTDRHQLKQINQMWNISEVSYSPHCAATIRQAIFVPIAYDERAYQTEGSNYYVTHMDSLIPLWNVLKKFKKSNSNSPLPEIYLFAFNVEGKVDLDTPAFDDYSKYWIQSIQLLLGDIPLQFGTFKHFSRHLTNALRSMEHSSMLGEYMKGYRQGMSLCFDDLLLGLPNFNPTRRAVQSYSHDFRMASLKHSSYAFTESNIADKKNHVDIATKRLCSTMMKKVGIVVRKGRRQIVHVDKFMKELDGLGKRWCNQSFLGGESDCGVHFGKVMFGQENENREIGVEFETRSSVERDIIPLQDYAVLFGIQGSGLINALYMPPVSSAVAVYLNDGWPISSADPLAPLGDRGPYIVHINNDTSKIICHYEHDKFCDSGDMIMDAETFEPVLIEALNQHLDECLKLRNR